MAERQIVEKGELSSGKLWEILESARSAVSSGKHLIAHALDQEGNILNHQDISLSEKAELFGVVLSFIEEEAAEGRCWLALNGLYYQKRPTFHIHLVFPEEDDKVLRFIFNIGDFATRLEEASEAESMEKVRELVEELMMNLK